MPKNVTCGGGYVRYIKSFRDVAFSDDEVRELVLKIEEGRLKAGRETNRRHVAGLKYKLKALSLGLSFLKLNQCLLIYLSLGKQENFKRN